MAISEAYTNTLKAKAVAEFVSENKRSPTESELRVLLWETYQKYSVVDQVGLSGFDINKPAFESVSSAEDENQNRYSFYHDLITISERIDGLSQQLEDSFRGFIATSGKTGKLLAEIESRLDNLVVLQDDSNVFIYGAEEDFTSKDKIDFENTTASVEPGYCVMGRDSYQLLDLSTVKLSHTITSSKGILTTQISSNIEHLKKNDGVYWEYLVYTKYKQGRVSLSLTAEMVEPTTVVDLKITGSPIGVNQLTTVTVFYSVDGENFSPIEPIERTLTKDESLFNIGIAEVKALKLVFSKGAADVNTSLQSQYIYTFSFDSLEIRTSNYQDVAYSELVAGPYEIVDELGAPVYFTKATLSACHLVDDDTSVNYFLSKDKENWYAVSSGDSIPVVSFAESTKVDTYSQVDIALDSNELLAEILGLDTLFSVEAFVNLKVSFDYVDAIPLKSIVLKRNVIGDSTALVYGTPPGWYFDSRTKQYTTTVYVQASEGRYIDFGPRGASVNGVALSGSVYLKQGYSTIATSDRNWKVIAGSPQTLDELEDADSLYPYNHKYLVEGFVYPQTYSGEKVYNGVDEYFGRLCTYMPPEHFGTLASAGRFDIFTIDNSLGDWYFKVKVDKTKASWKNELVDVNYSVLSDTTNTLYVKAILTTSDLKRTPTIESFKLRVI